MVEGELERERGRERGGLSCVRPASFLASSSSAMPFLSRVRAGVDGGSIDRALLPEEVVGHVARQLRHELRVGQLLGPRRTGGVRPLLRARPAFVAIVAWRTVSRPAVHGWGCQLISLEALLAQRRRGCLRGPARKGAVSYHWRAGSRGTADGRAVDKNTGARAQLHRRNAGRWW
jgi:hypothetical protein